MSSINEKLNILDSILRELDSFAVAFSGGVDSTFLLHRAHLVRKTGIGVNKKRNPGALKGSRS